MQQKLYIHIYNLILYFTSFNNIKINNFSCKKALMICIFVDIKLDYGNFQYIYILYSLHFIYECKINGKSKRAYI